MIPRIIDPPQPPTERKAVFLCVIDRYRPLSVEKYRLKVLEISPPPFGKGRVGLPREALAKWGRVPA